MSWCELQTLGLSDTSYFFWLCWVLVVACGLSLVAANGGYSLAAVLRLIAATSLVAEHRL